MQYCANWTTWKFLARIRAHSHADPQVQKRFHVYILFKVYISTSNLIKRAFFAVYLTLGKRAIRRLYWPGYFHCFFFQLNNLLMLCYQAAKVWFSRSLRHEPIRECVYVQRGMYWSFAFSSWALMLGGIYRLCSSQILEW